MNKIKIVFLGLITLMFLGSGVGYAGDYLNSAHGTQDGDITGASRLSDYTDGHCGHCHEQHSSVDGSEPSPTGGPDNYLLFDTSHTSQTANFCFDCHVDSSSQQAEGTQATAGDGYIYNYSYSYRAGNYDDSASNNDIKQAFGLTSSHDLDDMVTFITGKWGYTANSNPCSGCHNPHAAQGDPAGSTSAKTSSTRGYPVSLPSEHSTLTSWGLMGDESDEQMNDYSSDYQAPYRPGDTTYEPDGSATTNGSNLIDFVTFCQDCHSSTYGDMTASPYSLPNTPIDWDADGDKHGANSGVNTTVDLQEPYASGKPVGAVLSCTDCHEPHGSLHAMLIRTAVNGALVDYIPGGAIDAITIGPLEDLQELCLACHQQSTFSIHHGLANSPYPFAFPGGLICADCHNATTCPPGGGNELVCSNCHFHGGNDAVWLTDPASGVVNGAKYADAARHTF